MTEIKVQRLNVTPKYRTHARNEITIAEKKTMASELNVDNEISGRNHWDLKNKIPYVEYGVYREKECRGNYPKTKIYK